MMIKSKTVESESGLFCNIRKMIINDDECDFIEERRNDPYEIVGDYNFSYPYRLHSCKYCIKRNMRDIIEWEIPLEIQEYFPEMKNDYNVKDISICVLIMSIAVTILLFDYFIFISLL